jgi:tRNA nucleotidyltransferase (CCA-adding enzyme)
MACRLPSLSAFPTLDSLPRDGLTVTAQDVELIDLFGGREDLRDHVLRCVGEPAVRLREDALRILRGVRFCVQLGFLPDPATEQALLDCRAGLSHISAERIATELTRTLACALPCAKGLRLMSRTGLWQYVLPEVENSNISKYFKNQELLLDAVDALPNCPELRLAMLLCGTDAKGAKEACRRLKLSNKMTDAVSAYVGAIDRPCPKTDADVRRYLAALGDHAEGALCVAAACHADEKTGYEAALARAGAIRARGDCLAICDLAVDGDLLMRELGLRGRAVGEMLARLLDVVLEDSSKNEQEILLRIAGEM